MNYVQIKNFNSASKKLFDKPFPRDSNEFRVDQRLIAIDPEHESLFCVMTIVEIRGNVYCLIICLQFYTLLNTF